MALDTCTAWADITRADLPQVLQVEQSAYPLPWTESHFRSCLTQGYRCRMLQCACDLPSLLGYFVAMTGVQEVHLLNITVAPEHQRKGYALVMLNALRQWAPSVGAKAIWLEVRVSNQRAIQVYDRAGFRRVHLRKAYYPLDGLSREDALVMSLAL